MNSSEPQPVTGESHNAIVRLAVKTTRRRWFGTFAKVLSATLVIATVYELSNIVIALTVCVIMLLFWSIRFISIDSGRDEPVAHNLLFISDAARQAHEAQHGTDTGHLPPSA